MCYIAKPRTIVSPLTSNVPKCSFPLLVDLAGQEERPRKKSQSKADIGTSDSLSTSVPIRQPLIYQLPSKVTWSCKGKLQNIYTYLPSAHCEMYEKAISFVLNLSAHNRALNCWPVLHTSLRASPLLRSPLITRSIQCWCAQTHLLDTLAAAFCPWNMESVAIPMLLSALLETADLDGGNEGMPPICDAVNVSPRPAEHNLCLVASH